MEIIFDITAFERYAEQLGGALDQVPYSLSRAMNRAAENTRTVLITSTWPSSVRVFQPGFMRQALSTKFSTKRNLRIEIYDRLHRARLEQHAYGGTKSPRGSKLAIPVATFNRGSSGIPAAQRPRAIVATTPPRALRILPHGIFVGSGGRLNLMYALRGSANQPADVPFEQDFKHAFEEDVRTSFPAAILQAMATRR